MRFRRTEGRYERLLCLQAPGKGAFNPLSRSTETEKSAVICCGQVDKVEERGVSGVREEGGGAADTAGS